MIGQSPEDIPKTRVKFSPGDYVEGTLRTYDVDVSGDQFELRVQRLDVKDKYAEKDTIQQNSYRVGSGLQTNGNKLEIVLSGNETEKYKVGRRYTGVLFHGTPLNNTNGETRDRDLWVLIDPVDYYRL